MAAWSQEEDDNDDHGDGEKEEEEQGKGPFAYLVACMVAPKRLSINEPKTPAATAAATTAPLVPRASCSGRGGRAPWAMATGTAVAAPTTRPPITLAARPRRLTAPLVPGCAVRHGAVIRTGGRDDSTPSSEELDVAEKQGERHASWRVLVFVNCVSAPVRQKVKG